MNFLVFYFDPHEKIWYDTEAIFATRDDAKQEIRDLIDDWPDRWEGMRFVIVPNDGLTQAKYRPLDRGDQILYR